jgi:hypothetical protein
MADALQEQMIAVLTVRLVELKKALKGYYDQHQANGCDCQLCKAAEFAFQRTEG